MLRVIRRVSDEVLDVLLKGADAGACVPENGHYCRCVNHCWYRYTCTGACAPAPCVPC